MTNKLILNDQKITEGAELIIKRCGCLRPGESVVIVCDKTTRAAGKLLESQAKRITDKVTLIETAPFKMHGEEPSKEISDRMSNSDLCIGITAKSMAHTRARQQASAAGSRYLSLPEYSLELFADTSIRADYEARGVLARYLADVFTAGSEVQVSTAAGTRITMKIAGRIGNCCPGYVKAPGEMGSPPDIEANVSPLETSAEGVVVVDGAIPYPAIGLLKSPVILQVTGGRIVQMDGDTHVTKELDRLFKSARSDKAYVLAECGVGLNDKAVLTGVMLTDEGAAGTMHFGFGSNATVGGMNRVPFHLDFVFRDPNLSVDDELLLDKGEIQFSKKVIAIPGDRK